MFGPCLDGPASITDTRHTSTPDKVHVEINKLIRCLPSEFSTSFNTDSTSMDSPLERVAQVEAPAASVACQEGWPEEAQTSSPGSREASGRRTDNTTLAATVDEPAADESTPSTEGSEPKGSEGR